MLLHCYELGNDVNCPNELFLDWLICKLQPHVKNSVDLGVVYMEKLAPARVSYRDDFVISHHVYMDYVQRYVVTSNVLKLTKPSWIDRNYACATRSSLPSNRFHTETSGRFAFTWYSCEISYRSEILAPVREPGWTHPGATRAGMIFCGGIM